MEKTVFLFENSFLNLNVDSEEFMVSIFPNRLVLGEPFIDGYKKSKSFYFCLHEIEEFLAALGKCIEYVTFEKDDNNGKVLERTAGDIYMWRGEEIVHPTPTGDENIERKFKFIKEKSSDIDDYFTVTLSVHQTEIIIKIMNELILTMMCLKYSDRKILEDCINKNLITSFDNKDVIANVILQQQASIGRIENLSSLVDFIMFYKDIFKILSLTSHMREKLIYPQHFVDQIEAEIESLTQTRSQN